MDSYDEFTEAWNRSEKFKHIASQFMLSETLMLQNISIVSIDVREYKPSYFDDEFGYVVNVLQLKPQIECETDKIINIVMPAHQRDILRNWFVENQFTLPYSIYVLHIWIKNDSIQTDIIFKYLYNVCELFKGMCDTLNALKTRQITLLDVTYVLNRRVLDDMCTHRELYTYPGSEVIRKAIGVIIKQEGNHKVYTISRERWERFKRLMNEIKTEKMYSMISIK